MARKDRNWSKEFINYTNFIVKHKNYKGLAEPLKSDGSPRWIVSGNSPIGKERADWWDKKIIELGVTCRADVAREIHPKELGGLKPCQICGRKLSIFYVYPNKHTLDKINGSFKLKIKPYEYDIDQIFQKINDSNLLLKNMREIFHIPSNIPNDKELFLKFIKTNCKSLLSPGVMSNPPDRFEGFHTYNACCRSKEDTGRHKSNLARYSQDRRAYENWAGGDWNFSNRLMGEFKKYKTLIKCPHCGNIREVTADHIGPISLGFTHRPKFNPLCGSCNSGKNNRITLSDVKILIADEQNGEQVISWHSKYLWDNLKNKIKTEDDALRLSKAMRLNIHQILSILYLIKQSGGTGFLKEFLHPEYSFFDYKFENFNPLELNKLKIIKKPLENKNKTKNAQRYIRISLDSLDEYQEKGNRKSKDMGDSFDEKEINKITNLIKENKKEKAKEALMNLIQKVSQIIVDRSF